MTPEKTQRLHEAFPRLFGGRSSPSTKTGRLFFECGDGWYNLLWDLAERLEPFNLVAVQVKEKFGQLRFYVDASEAKGDPTWCRAIIQEAEELSATICEHCGGPGKLDAEHGWWQVLCQACRKPKGKDTTYDRADG